MTKWLQEIGGKLAKGKKRGLVKLRGIRMGGKGGARVFFMKKSRPPLLAGKGKRARAGVKKRGTGTEIMPKKRGIGEGRNPGQLPVQRTEGTCGRESGKGPPVVSPHDKKKKRQDGQAERNTWHPKRDLIGRGRGGKRMGNLGTRNEKAEKGKVIKMESTREQPVMKVWASGKGQKEKERLKTVQGLKRGYGRGLRKKKKKKEENARRMGPMCRLGNEKIVGSGGRAS